jgi:putative cardiolipin synthase
MPDTRQGADRRSPNAGGTSVRRTGRGLLAAFAAFLIAGAMLGGCRTLPSLDGRSVSTALSGSATQETRLGMAVAPLDAAHPGLTGIYALEDGMDAFSARIVLANAAQRSLDVQYYIWHDDITGMLLFDALRAAADRGVRVRLLLDDNNTSGLDGTLALLDAHPNIEVRLFNPFALRQPRALGYLGDFFRLNRRMHNKSFTADSQATIVGGRNVGDEYFGAAGDMLFADLDLLAIGPVVDAVAHDFDRYWNSRSAYPLQLLVPAAPGGPTALAEQAAQVKASAAAQDYLKAARASAFVAQLEQRSLPIEWTQARLVSDDPAKVLGQVAEESKVRTKLRQLFGEPAAEVDLVSPYFVPGEEGAEALGELARRGVKVKVLTNSLEATDVAAVHAGYAKWRRDLLASGVSLYELRRSWAGDGTQETGDMAAHKRAKTGPLGSSSASLHAKAFAVDGKRVFVGSFNFDPRSAELNTEMGFVLDSTALAQRMTAELQRRMPLHAYEVHLAPDGSLYWIRHEAAGDTRYDTEPGTTFFQRTGVRLLSWLPIEWLL